MAEPSVRYTEDALQNALYKIMCPFFRYNPSNPEFILTFL